LKPILSIKTITKITVQTKRHAPPSAINLKPILSIKKITKITVQTEWHGQRNAGTVKIRVIREIRVLKPTLRSRQKTSEAPPSIQIIQAHAQVLVDHIIRRNQVNAHAQQDQKPHHNQHQLQIMKKRYLRKRIANPIQQAHQSQNGQ
jgi:hypothetical protein